MSCFDCRSGFSLFHSAWAVIKTTMLIPLNCFAVSDSIVIVFNYQPWFVVGNFCPICHKCYSDDDWDCKMVQCARCESWVHASCEGLSGLYTTNQVSKQWKNYRRIQLAALILYIIHDEISFLKLATSIYI